MKSRASVMVLLAMAVLLPLSHLELEAADDSWLLLVDGRPVDVAGWASEQYAALTRDCDRVKTLQAGDRLYGDVLSALRQHSPPDSLSAQLLALNQEGEWLLALVQFSRLQNAVVLLRATDQGVALAEGGVWSGSTHPHRPEPLIRRYLHSRVPGVPGDLMACWRAPW